MLVSEMFDYFDLDEMMSKAEDSDYLAAEYEFVEKVWSRDFDSLSEKQKAWLDKIAKKYNK